MVEDIREAFSISELSAQVLRRRFSSLDEIQRAIFPNSLSAKFEEHFKDEILQVEQLLVKSKSILIYSDYDADGLMSLRIFRRLLRKNFNREHVYVIINERSQGYGILPTAVKSILELKPDVLVTADLGSSTPREILDAFKKHNIKVVITDHHAYSAEPACNIFINPYKTELKYYTGAGVITRVLSRDSALDQKTICEMSIAAVADSAQILYDNRYIVKKAIRSRRWPKWAGVDEVRDIRDIAFKIVPEINAVSRVGSIKKYLKLLDKDIEAKEYARKLNEARKELTKAATKIGFAQAYKQVDQEVLVIELPDKYHGLYGIVASRLCGAFKKPAIVGHSEKQAFKASARDFFSEAPLMHILKRAKDAFNVTHLGGHVAAFGCEFQVEASALIELFKKVKLSDFKDLVLEEEKVKAIEIDLYMSAEEVVERYQEIEKMCKELSPFGNGFPPVAVLISDAEKILKIENNKVFLDLPQAKVRLYNVDADSIIRDNAFILKISGIAPEFEAENA